MTIPILTIYKSRKYFYTCTKTYAKSINNKCQHEITNKKYYRNYHYALL